MALWQPIPGETPIDDVSGLKIKGIVTRKRLNELEARNIRKAVVKYLAKKPSRRSARFDLAWTLTLHKQMFGDVWKWAGRIRRSNTNIGVAWEHVETSLFTLLGDLQFWAENDSFDFLEQAMRLHHRAVRIHPFENGNGRWSRLLANVWLRLHEQPLTIWPEETVGEQSAVRDEYLQAIRLADAGEYDRLRELHRRLTAQGSQ